MSIAIPLPSKESNDIIFMAQTIFGEARGSSWNAKLAVANVILNRKKAKRKYFGKSIKTIVQKPQQFSCWNHRDVNRAKIYNPLKYDSVDTWLECYVAARLVLEGQVKDNTNGALYYIDESIIHDPPSWLAKLKLSARHGKLYFYRETKVTV